MNKYIRFKLSLDLCGIDNICSYIMFNQSILSGITTQTDN